MKYPKKDNVEVEVKSIQTSSDAGSTAPPVPVTVPVDTSSGSAGGQEAVASETANVPKEVPAKEPEQTPSQEVFAVVNVSGYLVERKLWGKYETAAAVAKLQPESARIEKWTVPLAGDGKRCATCIKRLLARYGALEGFKSSHKAALEHLDHGKAGIDL